MAESLELPLPELAVEDFKRGWTRFELVANAKGWDAARQLAVIPTLLRGKLIDYYVELSDAAKSDLGRLKAALLDRTGVKTDALLASKQFTCRSQGPDEKIKDFAFVLKQLFKEAYPAESLDSAVLLQHFLTGLRPEIGRQLLLRNRPDTFANALKDAEEIEYALAFDDSGEGINAIQHKKKQSEHQDTPALSQTLEALTKRLESLETTLQMNAKAQGSFRSKRGGRRQAITQQNFRTPKVGPCYNCGQEGHLYRSCPLKFQGPVPRVDGSWPHRY